MARVHAIDASSSAQLVCLLHRSYLEISRQAGDQEMQGRACVAYADCQHKLGQLDGAVESLESFLQLTHSQVTAGAEVAGEAITSMSYIIMC